MIKIKYVGGSGVRRIEAHEWNADNGYVASVPASLAASLLTYPRPDFNPVVPQKVGKGDSKILAEEIGLTTGEVAALFSAESGGSEDSAESED